jgi:hypothetical protein
MKTLTELETEIKDRFKDKTYGDFTVSLTRKNKNIKLTIKQMYNHISFNFKDTLFLSDLFKTTDIDSYKYSSGGCITCGYRSEYGTEFTIKNIGIELKEVMRNNRCTKQTTI